jgi:hypothetical protein
MVLADDVGLAFHDQLAHALAHNVDVVGHATES